MTRKVYPSDISQEQFEQVKDLLENAKKKTNPRKVDLYDIFCAVLYLLREGCRWRALPGDFPPRGTVRYYFDQWRAQGANGEPSLLEQALKNQVAQERERHGRAEKTTFGIVDAQSVKNADTAQEKGYDAGKKVSGIKRHLTVDTNGLPHTMHITTANVGDRQGGLEMVARHRDTLSEVVNLLVDGGYTGDNFAQGVAEILGASMEVAKRPELHKFAVMPKRWVVERSFA